MDPSPVPGKTDAPAHFRFAKLLLILVAADLAAKLVAWFFFRGSSAPASGNAFLQLNIIVNDTGSNAALDYYGIGGDLRVLLASLFVGLLGTYVILIQRAKIPTARKIIVGVALYGALSMILAALPDSNESLFSSRYVMGLIKLAGPLVFYGSLYYFTESPDFKFCWMLMIAGGIGNLLSYFYPPFGVVDFILMRMPDIGDVVFNLADVFSTASIVLLIGVAIYRLVKYLRNRSRSRAAAA